MAAKKRAVVVTTAHRGVFVGYTTQSKTSDKNDTIALTDARMVVYYSAATRGALGIASMGPQLGSRVSPAVDGITLRSVTSVADASGDAVKAWEAEPWG